MELKHLKDLKALEAVCLKTVHEHFEAYRLAGTDLPRAVELRYQRGTANGGKKLLAFCYKGLGLFSVKN